MCATIRRGICSPPMSPRTRPWRFARRPANRPTASTWWSMYPFVSVKPKRRLSMARQKPEWLQVFDNPALNKKAMSGIVGFSRPPYISIEGDEFTFWDEQGAGENYGKVIEAVIVDANYGISRLYFAERYTPGRVAVAPPCFSDNGRSDNDPEQRPSASASQPQSSYCQGCRHNVFGTDVHGTGRGKACREYKKLAVMFDGHVYLLGVPPNSLKSWETYVEHISNANVSVNQVRTKVSFASEPRGTLQFEALGYAGD